MKDMLFTRLICEAACSFYKPGKEELLCEGYNYLIRTYSPETLGELTGGIMMNALTEKGFADFKARGAETLLCDQCDFRVNGCDFAEDCSGLPCGGYLIVLSLMQSQKSCTKNQ